MTLTLLTHARAHTGRPISCLSLDVFSFLTGHPGYEDTGQHNTSTTRPLANARSRRARGGLGHTDTGAEPADGGHGALADLPLLLLPGRVEQQVAVPLLLLDHVLVIVIDVVVLHAGLYLVHGARGAGAAAGRAGLGRTDGRAGGDAAGPAGRAELGGGAGGGLAGAG